jgi:hypothetical protein
MLNEEPQEPRRLNGLTDLNTVIRDVRNFIVGLEPEILKGRELKTALKSLVLTMNESGSARRKSISGGRRFDSQAATQLLHIGREAMSKKLTFSSKDRGSSRCRKIAGAFDWKYGMTASASIQRQLIQAVEAFRRSSR